MVLSLVGVSMYFLYEKPSQEDALKNAERINFSIYATDIDTGKDIQTGYILSDGFDEKKGTTMEGGAVFDSIMINHSLTITSVNLANQSYYTAQLKKDYFGSGYENQRIILNMIQPGRLNIERLPDTMQRIRFNVSTDTRYLGLAFCVKWSSHLVSVKSSNGFTTITEKPNVFSNFDRCFDTGRSLFNESCSNNQCSPLADNHNEAMIPLDYTYFGTLDRGDFIDIVFFDSDPVLGFENIDEGYSYRVVFH